MAHIAPLQILQLSILASNAFCQGCASSGAVSLSCALHCLGMCTKALVDAFGQSNALQLAKQLTAQSVTHLRVRKAAHISMAPQKETSPSPWLKCMSPILRFAPSTKTGKYTCHAAYHVDLPLHLNRHCSAVQISSQMSHNLFETG